MDKIILTNYKKLPYKPLSRNEFLTLLLIDIYIKKDKILKLKNNTNDLEAFQKQPIANYDMQIEFVKKIAKYNKNDIKKNATISVAHKNYPNQYPKDAHGSGTYSISNFTLTLNYADGRKRTCTFAGNLDKNPTTDNRILYIEGNLFCNK